MDTVLTVGTKSDHEILRARGFNEIYQFNQVYLGIKNSGGKKTFGIFIALNQFDNVVLLLPISEIFMQIQDNIAGLIFSSGIYIEQDNRLCSGEATRGFYPIVTFVFCTD